MSKEELAFPPRDPSWPNFLLVGLAEQVRVEKNSILGPEHTYSGAGVEVRQVFECSLCFKRSIWDPPGVGSLEQKTTVRTGNVGEESSDPIQPKTFGSWQGPYDSNTRWPRMVPSVLVSCCGKNPIWPP